MNAESPPVRAALQAEKGPGGKPEKDGDKQIPTIRWVEAVVWC
jgi:hypothetical protein